MRRAFIAIAVVAVALVTIATILLRSVPPAAPNDPFLRAANCTGAFDVPDALTGEFTLFNRFENLPSGLQKAILTASGREIPFNPKCVMANVDEPVNSDVMLPGICTGTYFLFGGINQQTAFVVDSSPNGFCTTRGAIVFSLAGNCGVWQANLGQASITDLPTLRAANANEQSRQRSGRTRKFCEP